MTNVCDTEGLGFGAGVGLGCGPDGDGTEVVRAALMIAVGRDVAEALARPLLAITVTRILWPMSAVVSL
jgi:hypothetical protein